MTKNTAYPLFVYIETLTVLLQIEIHVFCNKGIYNALFIKEPLFKCGPLPIGFSTMVQKKLQLLHRNRSRFFNMHVTCY